jgi:hypothetical protein
MPILRKKKVVCRKVGENDGVKHLICETEPNKIFDVFINKDGTATIKPHFILVTPEDYRKIEEYMRSQNLGVSV